MLPAILGAVGGGGGGLSASSTEIAKTGDFNQGAFNFQRNSGINSAANIPTFPFAINAGNGQTVSGVFSQASDNGLLLLGVAAVAAFFIVKGV